MEPLRWKRESAVGLCGALLMLGVVNAIFLHSALLDKQCTLRPYFIYHRLLGNHFYNAMHAVDGITILEKCEMNTSSMHIIVFLQDASKNTQPIKPTF